MGWAEQNDHSPFSAALLSVILYCISPWQALSDASRVRLLSGASAVSEKAPSVSNSALSGGSRVGAGGVGAHAGATGASHVEMWLHSHFDPCDAAKQANPSTPALAPAHTQWKSATPLYVDRGGDEEDVEDAQKSDDTLFLSGISDVNGEGPSRARTR